jgi:hypothetical protein
MTTQHPLFQITSFVDNVKFSDKVRAFQKANSDQMSFNW